MRATASSTTNYTCREVHTISSPLAEVTVTFADGAVWVEVDDQTGRGPVEYAEHFEPDLECFCEASDRDQWDEGRSEGVWETLSALHDQTPRHWGAVETCYSEPCLALRTQIAW